LKANLESTAFAEAMRQRDALQAECDELRTRVCNECNGLGFAHIGDVKVYHGCALGKLVMERDELRAMVANFTELYPRHQRALDTDDWDGEQGEFEKLHGAARALLARIDKVGTA